jgi:hypothetical protein
VCQAPNLPFGNQCKTASKGKEADKKLFSREHPPCIKSYGFYEREKERQSRTPKNRHKCSFSVKLLSAFTVSVLCRILALPYNIFYGYFVCQRQKTGDRKEPARVNISSALFIEITLSF